MGKENKVECRFFCDLPSSIFLAIQNKGENPWESLNSYIHRKIDEYSEDTDNWSILGKSYGTGSWSSGIS